MIILGRISQIYLGVPKLIINYTSPLINKAWMNISNRTQKCHVWYTMGCQWQKSTPPSSPTWEYCLIKQVNKNLHKTGSIIYLWIRCCHWCRIYNATSYPSHQRRILLLKLLQNNPIPVCKINPKKKNNSTESRK